MNRILASVGLALTTAVAVALNVTCTGVPPVLLPGVGGGTPQPFSFSLRVARHIDQEFSAGRLDTILAQASSILQTVEEDCPDVSCPVTFQRSGAIETFDGDTAIITSEAQLDAVFAHPADIKIVTLMVGVCGVSTPGEMTEILGCAVVGDSVVISQDAPFDVWAHEWGHVQGLPHRNDCWTNIMHSVALETNAVDEGERDAFLSPTPSGLFFKAPPADKDDLGLSLRRQEDETPAAWVERVVSRRYIAGLPSAAVADAPLAETAALLEEAMWGEASAVQRRNAIRALGLLGDHELCPELIRLLDEFSGVLSAAELATASEALLALGRLAGDDPTGQAVEYLIAATTPQTWSERGLVLRRAQAEDISLADALGRISILSLGIADHPTARAHLLELSARVAAGRSSGPWLTEQVSEALARSQAQVASLSTPPPTDRMP